MVPGRKRFPEIWPQASRNLGQGQVRSMLHIQHPVHRFQVPGIEIPVPLLYSHLA